MARGSDYGAFMEKFLLQPSSSPHVLPLNSLTFAVKDIFDVEGYVTGFGNPDWLRTHPAATSTAPAILAILRGGATCVGKTVMDGNGIQLGLQVDLSFLCTSLLLCELLKGQFLCSTHGINRHYGTPRNPCVPDRVPGGSSSGSAVAVGAKLVDFALGTDTGGSVRVPASYCGILGFRPSHDAISTAGVIPLHKVLILLDFGVLAIPTVQGPPPKLLTDPPALDAFRVRAYDLLSIAGASGFCQVSIPLGLYENLPVAISLLAKHGSDGFLLNLVETLYSALKEEVGIAENLSY
ncbi:Amidase 1 [Morella rubra]|uniref:Amidase 1 n=1 Tax=Morella rubra TaxID=262757 RepID=A0A6A1UPM3_9ROSI|nr:Amidase 1 [Morella rubra]